MYNDYFGFSESPFNITPNPRFYYRTQSCDAVLEVVQHGIKTRKGLIVVVGEPGSGKTLFLKFLVRDLAPKAEAVLVGNPLADLDEILRHLLERLELHGHATDRSARLDRLTEDLIRQRKEGRMACLLIDEAQDLDINTLDELRILANLEFEGDALLPIVLVGQPELNLKLDQPSAIRIKQRVALTRNIYPLIRKEVGPYIASRLRVAGCEKSGLFDPEAIDTIAAHSGGIPRMVNSICDNSLFRAYTMKQRVISARIVDQVARELRITAALSFQKQFIRSGESLTRTDKNPSFTHRGEGRSVELFEAEKQGASALHRSSDFQVSKGTHPSSGDPHTFRASGTQMPPKSAPDARQGSEWLPPLRARSGNSHGLLAVRVRWFAFAGAVALLLLALNIVDSSPLASLYSVLSGKPQTTVADPASLPSPHRDDIKSAPVLGIPPITKETGTNRDPFDASTPKAGTEIDASKTINEGNGNSAHPLDPSAPPPDDGLRQAPTDSSVVKKNENKPSAVTLEVTARSKVRAKPNDGSEIIAELEPGNRVTVLAQSRDYYHVRSVDDKSIRGYVHREDAFFETKNSRQKVSGKR